MLSLLEPLETDFDFEAARDYGWLGGHISLLHRLSSPAEIQAYDIAVLGVPEDRNAIDKEGCKYAPDEIRKSLYRLYPGKWNKKIIDLGNLKITSSMEETYENLTEVLTTLLKQDTAVILLGGSHDLTYAVSKSLDRYNKPYNLCVIDSSIDSAVIDEQMDNHNFLTKMLSNDSSFLQNLSIFGIQTYYNHPSKFEIFDRLYVDYYKLGEIHQNIMETEPEIREADLLSIDINALKNADMPAQSESKPNGLKGYDLCVMTRLAGIAPQNKILGIFELNPFFDKNRLGSNLTAQMIWYYIEGKNAYREDYPAVSKKELTKFYVNNEIIKLNFYKNPKTQRWWVEIPDITGGGQLYACSEKDYQQAVALKISKRIYHIINKTSI